MRKLNSHVVVPALGGLAGIASVALGLTILIRHVSTFWVGVGIALVFAGFVSGKNGFQVALQNRSLPEFVPVERDAGGLREWWTTPKFYPSGDKFTPRESFLYGGIIIGLMVVCLVGIGLSFELIASGFAH